MGVVVSRLKGSTSILHKFHEAHIIMIPNKTIMCRWSFDVDDVTCALRVLAGNLSVEGGDWWSLHACKLVLLCGELLSCFFVVRWACLEVVLCARAPVVRQCLPLRFCRCPHCLAMRVPWPPLWRVAMGAVVLWWMCRCFLIAWLLGVLGWKVLCHKVLGLAVEVSSFAGWLGVVLCCRLFGGPRS